MEENKYRILVVDDEEDICEILKFNLETEGYDVETAGSAEEALTLKLNTFDLLLFDVMMGEMSGFALARRLKKDESTRHLPVIFLTARDTENDMITGFSLGADDYIAKPFSIHAVKARIKAVLRRTARQDIKTEADLLRHKGLALCPDKKTVAVDGNDVSLTRTEFGLLHTLMKERGRVFSRHELITKVWPQDVLVLDRTVDVSIARLRKKIEPYSECIATRPGFGYSFKST